MEKLLRGVVNFQKEDFESHKELFKELGKQQKPHTLFIGCSDSRIVPNLITKTLPGELFVVRNIANLVPPYRTNTDYAATTSAIEYAVIVLEVENIIVCGHSNCGGCACIHKEEAYFENVPNVKKWLELTDGIKEKVNAQIPKDDILSREWLTEQINIVEQIKRLFSYPFVVDKYKKGNLKIYGWYYIIETGEVYNYNSEKQIFELIK